MLLGDQYPRDAGRRNEDGGTEPNKWPVLEGVSEDGLPRGPPGPGASPSGFKGSLSATFRREPMLEASDSLGKTTILLPSAVLPRWEVRSVPRTVPSPYNSDEDNRDPRGGVTPRGCLSGPCRGPQEPST